MCYEGDTVLDVTSISLPLVVKQLTIFVQQFVKKNFWGHYYWAILKILFLTQAFQYIKCFSLTFKELILNQRLLILIVYIVNESLNLNEAGVKFLHCYSVSNFHQEVNKPV